MKANEIPERIYSIPTEGGFYLTTIKPEPPFADGIEYTRTDAFIEKACEWMEKNGCGYWLDDSALPNRDLIDDFRNYMKGE